MKLNIESKIKKESITKLVQKSVDVGKKVASSTKENVTYAIEKQKLPP